MKSGKILIFVFILLILTILLTPIKNAYTIPKDKTALVDLSNLYWNYNKTQREKKRLQKFKDEMMSNLKPMLIHLNDLRQLISNQSHSKKVKYEYMKEYFISSGKIQTLITQYNEQLRTYEQQIRENLLAEIWNSVKTYIELKDYEYVFRIGQNDVLAYDRSIDITNEVSSFINTVPNAAELEIIGEALVIKNNARIDTGKGIVRVTPGKYITILSDPIDALKPDSNGLNIISDKSDYYITAMYEGTIGLISVTEVTTNIKSRLVDLKLGNKFQSYLGFENHIYSERNSETNKYELILVKIPRLYIQKEGENDTFKSLEISKRNLKECKISEIRDINNDGELDIVIKYTNDKGTFLKTLRVKEKQNSINVSQTSPTNDFIIDKKSVPAYAGRKGEVIKTLSDNNKYYSLEEDGSLLFTQFETEFYYKSKYEDEINPYKLIRPVKKYSRYTYDYSKNKFVSKSTESVYLELTFKNNYSLLYESIGNIDHIAEIRKGKSFHIERAVSGGNLSTEGEHDLWFRIIVEKTFEDRNELFKEGFPHNKNDSIYNHYEEKSSGEIFVRFYAFIHGEKIDAQKIIEFLDLPLGLYQRND